MKNKYTFLLIITLAFLLRAWDFGNNPPGLYVDEASHGYNAYSLLVTGKDEYGMSFPIFLRSFGTYPSALYTYLTVVPIHLLGLTATSVRLVSLISGIVLVILVTKFLGKIEGFVIAIAPVFVFFSRAAFEANLALTLFFAGVLLGLQSQKQQKLLPVSYALLVLSSYAYHAERFLGPFFILFFTLYYWRRKFSKYNVIVSCLLAIGLILPLLKVSWSTGANARLTGLSTNLFESIRLYSSYFFPNNLFSKPDPDLQRSFPELSVFYWWMIFPFIIGLWQVIKNRSKLKVQQKVLLIITIISPIPGALTTDYFSTLRVLPMFLGISWIIAQGLKNIIGKRNVFYILILFIAVIELYSNLVLLKHERSEVWGSHFQQLASFSKSVDKSLLIDNSRQKPIYILLAYYNRYDPKIFQTQEATWLNSYYDHVDFENNKTMGNIEIRPIVWEKDVYQDQIIVADILAISSEQAAEHKLKLIKTIHNINNQSVLNVYQTNPKEKCTAAKTFSLCR